MLQVAPPERRALPGKSQVKIGCNIVEENLSYDCLAKIIATMIIIITVSNVRLLAQLSW